MTLPEQALRSVLAQVAEGSISPAEADARLRRLRQDAAAGPGPQPRAASGHFALVLERPGSIDEIALREIEPRAPGAGEVQVGVRAFSINFGDLLCVKGLYPTMPDYPFTPGFELSGVVAAVGSGVSRFSVGDAVVGLVGQSLGGHASSINLPERQLVHKPSRVTHEEACALPIVYMTAFRAFELAQPKADESILIQTAAGGTGLVAVQLARQCGAHIYATAGSQEKLDYLRSLGVEHLINYREEDFSRRVLELSGGRGVDVVLNTLPGDAIQKGIDLLAPGGRYVEIAMTALRAAPPVRIGRLDENQAFYSVDLRRLLTSDAGLAVRYLERVAEVLRAGSVRGPVNVFSEDRIQEAYRSLEQRGNIGKVVVAVRPRELSSTLRPSPSSSAPQATDAGRVAIIGMAGRFPGAPDLATFWSNLANGVCSVREVPSARWSLAEHYHPDPRRLDKTHARRGGFLDSVDEFDPAFFSISGREANYTDPQQRLFLETAWNALDDAGYAVEASAEARCSIFVGVGPSDYVDVIRERGVALEPQAFWGNEPSVLAARVAYFLNLKGAAVAVNTACSSSLVALHLACQSLLRGESDLALAGGVFVRLAPQFFILNSNAGMLSPDGVCHAFDQRANGFVPGEGVGVVVLKRLETALRDGDHIHAVVLSTGTNQDGRTNGITAPNVRAQAELEAEVYARGGIDPDTITLVEAHGTGTKLGDPIEVEALTRAFREHTARSRYCALGSVKTNIGHSVAAAGIAGVLKAVQALRHGQLPPSLHFDVPNEHIPFPETPFFVNTELRVWPRPGGLPRRAAVSSFGFSGTNAHVVLEEALPRASRAVPLPASQLFLLSAKTASALSARARDLAGWLERHPDVELGDVAFTACAGRSHFAFRVALVAGDREELRAQLLQLAANERRSGCQGTQEDAADLDGEALAALAQRVNAVRSEDERRAALQQLAERYCAGAALPARALFPGEYRRVPLPGYPFERVRCWFPEAPAAMPAALSAATGGPGIDVYETWIDPEDAVARDHRVQGQRVVPGVYHFELALAALRARDGADARQCDDVVWLQPLVIDERRPVRVVLGPKGDSVAYRVESDREGGTVVHSRGTLRVNPEPSPVMPLPLDDVRARCMRSAGERPYRALEQLGIVYGPLFQGLRELWTGAGEALGRVEQLSGASGTGADYTLSPTLLDGALQATIGVTAVSSEGSSILPFAVERLRVFAPLPRAVWAHVQARPQPLCYDVGIFDDAGECCAQLLGVTFREQRDPLEGMLYVPVWVREPEPVAPLPDRSAPHRRLVVIAAGPLGLEQSLLAALDAYTETVWLGAAPSDVPSARVLDTRDPECFARYLAQRGGFDAVVFVCVRAAREPAPASGSADVVQLFRLVRALDGGDHGACALSLRVLTHGAASLGADDAIRPEAAALVGFCRSVAREYRAWSVACLDVPGGDAALEAIGRFARDPRPAPLEQLMRHGQRFVRQIVPARLPAPAHAPFREGGVYLLLGGAGGVGVEIAKHLLDVYRGHVVLVGRRPRASLGAAARAFLERAGASALYEQADACELASMQAAVARASEVFGALHGVFHCALVLEDRRIANHDETSFRAALDVKVDGSLHLFHATRDQPLDFFMFASSAQALVGDAGQSNYVAGCCFKDRFAEHMQRLVAYPVSVINWGYWGDVGAVSTGAYRERLLARGIEPIRSQEGLEVVRRAAAVRGLQLLALRASEALLRDQGVNLEWRIELARDLPAAPPAAPPAWPSPPPAAGAALGALDDLDRLGRRLLVRALWDGLAASGPHLTRRALAERVGVVPRYARLFDALVSALLAEGALVGSNGVLRVAFDVPPWTSRELRNEGERLAREHELGPHVELLAECADSLPQVLRGTVAATDVLFPGSSMRRVEAIYCGSALIDYFNEVVAAAMLAYPQTQRAGAGDVLHVLEVGAGTGGTSATLLRRLAAGERAHRYVYSDVSKSFLQFGAQRFAGEKSLEFRLFDAEQPPQQQGFGAREFDVVVATNVLHATESLAHSLRHLKSLLRPGGWLILNELTSVRDFATLTFGLLEGWWRFRDAECRLAHAPLASTEAWRALLAEAGFAPLWLRGVPGQPRDAGQHVIVASSDGRIQRSVRAPRARDAVSPMPEAAPVPRAAAPRLSRNGTGETGAGNASAAPRASAEPAREAVVRQITAVLAEVLGTSGERIEASTPYQELGVDSLLAATVAERLSALPGVVVKSTDLFNYPTVGALAAHVASQLGNQPAPASDLMTGSAPEPPAPAQTAPNPWSPATASAADERTKPRSARDVAIIGMAGKFPDAPDVERFWANLAAGRDSVREATRWDLAEFYDADVHAAGKSYGKWLGQLDDIDRFDPLFFQLSPREAELMDPQQRLFLEQAFKAIEDAGYAGSSLSDRNVGVFVGSSAGDYGALLERQGVLPEAHCFTGNANSILAARLAYHLNLKGPSIPVDTACSSSLVALHLACESIRNRTCELALAGGVAVMNTPTFLVLASRAGMLSPTGRCKTFDGAADGFVPGEAVGAVLLKELSAAVRDGDNIYGVICASGVNQDGRTNGITSPSAPSQARLERDVYARFGVEPAHIGYVEAHGTGTKLGDPIEIEALTQAFRSGSPRGARCAVGSVKTNIGHALTGAGIASLIKVLLCLKHQRLVPSLHYRQQNPLIELEGSPFFVNTAFGEWPRPGRAPRHAAISSFGFSGTNAHIVVREAPARTFAPASGGPHLILLSAKTPVALELRRQALRRWLDQHGHEQPLDDVAATLALGRTPMPIRNACVVADVKELQERLESSHKRWGPPDPDLSGAAARALEELAAGTLDIGQRAQRLETLACAFVAGMALDWGRLWSERGFGRVSLPTYAFAGERYGVPRGPLAPGWLHPLIQRNVSGLRRVCFASRFSGAEPWFSDHVIRGKRLLPAAAFLEMGRAAAALAVGAEIAELREVVLLRSLEAVGEAPPVCEIVLSERGADVAFQILSRDAEGRSTSHAEGVASRGPLVRGARCDLAALRARCGESWSPERCQARFRAMQVMHGPSLQSLVELRRGGGEVWAELALPDTSTSADSTLHPALLDGAFQSLIALGDGDDTRLLLPVAVGRVSLFGELGNRCWVYGRPSARHASPGPLSFDFSLCDPAGEVQVQIDGLSLRPVGAAMGAAPPRATNGLGLAASEADPALWSLLQDLKAGLVSVDDAEARMG